MVALETADDEHPATDVIWVDDFITSLDGAISAVEALGYRVHRFSSYEELPTNISNYRYFIFDGKIGRNSRAGEQFMQSAQFTPGSRVIMYSGYASSGILESGKNNVDSDVIAHHYIKNNDGSQATLNIVANKFSNFFETGEFLDPAIEPEDDTRNAHMNYEDFQALPFELRAVFSEQFYQRNQKAIDKAFDAGLVWGAWFDDDSEPLLSTKSVSDIPSDADVERKASQIGKVPFVFRNDLQFDDNGITRCASNKRDVSTYPIASLDISSQSRQIHFDQGSDASFFNSRFVSEINAQTKGVDQQIVLRSKGSVFSARRVEFGAVVDVHEVGRAPDWHKVRSGTASLEVHGYAVANWAAGPFTVECGPGCIKDGVPINGTCQYRSDGLLGRTLVDDNGIGYLCLSKANKIIFCVEPPDESDSSDH